MEFPPPFVNPIKHTDTGTLRYTMELNRESVEEGVKTVGFKGQV
jgi:hypothetical protein